jgi:hypothetical protein
MNTIDFSCMFAFETTSILVHRQRDLHAGILGDFVCVRVMYWLLSIRRCLIAKHFHLDSSSSKPPCESSALAARGHACLAAFLPAFSPAGRYHDRASIMGVHLMSPLHTLKVGSVLACSQKEVQSCLFYTCFAIYLKIMCMDFCISSSYMSDIFISEMV